MQPSEEEEEKETIKMRSETSNIKDLPELHRMGHTCANLNGELLFFWGGSDYKCRAHVSTQNTHLWIYETLTGYWRRKSCTGECPPNLSGSTSSLIGQKMYIFGGFSSLHDDWLNSLYCLDLQTFTWKDLGARADAKPSKPIRSDKCVSWSYEGRLYVFGGYGWSQTEHLLQLLDKQKDLHLMPDQRWPKLGWNNQLVEFDPRDNTWRWPSYSGQCPSARAAHSGALVGTKYYLFGGRDSRERLNDLYTFDMLTHQWNQVTIISTCPSVDQPIRHLLEGADVVVVEQELGADEVMFEVEEDSLIQEDDRQLLQESPHSSNGAARLTEQKVGGRASTYGSDDEECDSDELDYPADYPHPSHMLERWSLSSTQSATSSSTHHHMDNIDCSQTQTHTQSLNNNNNDQTPNYANQIGDTNAQDDLQRDVAEQRIGENNALDTDLIPAGRSFSSFTQISPDLIMLYGGVNSQDKNLVDCWVFNIRLERWTKLDLKINQARMWHTGSRTKNNEVVVVGGSCSEKLDEFCSDVTTLSLEPKSLKKLSLDSVVRNIRLRSIHKVKGLPSNICKLIRLRKQAMALTMRGSHNRTHAAVSQ